MSFHDRLAHKAIVMGKSSQAFSAAAQQHANATWFFGVAAVIIWYFFGWSWAALPIVVAIYAGAKSVSATMVASRIENLEGNAAQNESAPRSRP